MNQVVPFENIETTQQEGKIYGRNASRAARKCRDEKPGSISLLDEIEKRYTRQEAVFRQQLDNQLLHYGNMLDEMERRVRGSTAGDLEDDEEAGNLLAQEEAAKVQDIRQLEAQNRKHCGCHCRARRQCTTPEQRFSRRDKCCG